MAAALFSPSWYRVAKLRPRLRSHVEIHRHSYRDQIWHVLQDHALGRLHRLTPAAYRFIGLMTGTKTVDELWTLANERGGEEAPTQEEVIRLLGQLHAADAMICDVPPDARELFRRNRKQERQKWKQRLWTPLAIRVPLLDPDRFLDRTAPFVRPLFGRLGFVLWLAIVIAGVTLAATNWQAITHNMVDRVLTPHNLLLLWLVYPTVKALHELGHAYSTKLKGGEVQEIGMMFLVFIPVPYVDASASTAFPSRWQRAGVAAMGIMVEMALAAVALFVWLNAETGAVHAIAYNVMLIGGVSTLLFNGNPLLRFDGYYVLADLIEIPNLGSRANAYWGYLVKRHLFGRRDTETPAHDRGERIWFVVYGAAAFIYRFFIMFAIILYVGTKFFTIGIALAIWAVVAQVIVPLGKAMSFLFKSPELERRRGRAVLVTALAAVSIVVALFVLPMPLYTRTEGVTWPSDNAQVRSAVDGFVKRVVAADGTRVASGDPLIELEDPFLSARIRVLEAQVKGLERQFASLRNTDRVEAQVTREELRVVGSDLARSRERAAALTVSSPRSGVLIVPGAQHLPGRFAQKGQLLAYVVDDADRITARTVVRQDNVKLVRERTRRVHMMESEWDAPSIETRIVREVPGGSRQLPSPALGTMGGGSIPTDPRDGKGLTALERVFEFEILLPTDEQRVHIGQRIHVRFDLGTEPLGFQLYRSVRQLFLRLFDV